MAHTLEDGLRVLRDSAERASSIRIEIDDEYRRVIQLAEALPQNQSGADKTWVWRMEHAFREHFKRARPA
jgi:hypothetical protein